MSLWSIIPAAVGLGITALNKPKKKDYMPNTDYMDRYINSLRGRKRTQETYNLAMRPVLRQIGTQTARTRRQTGYELERQDAGGGAVLQSEISIGRQALQSTAQASDRAMALQGQDNRRIDERIAQTTMQREQMESQAHQAWDRATSQWKTKMWGQAAGAVAGAVSGGIGAAVQSATAIKQAHATAVEGGLVSEDVTLEQFKEEYDKFGDNYTDVLVRRQQTGQTYEQLKSRNMLPKILGEDDEHIMTQQEWSEKVGEQGLESATQEIETTDQINKIGNYTQEIFGDTGKEQFDSLIGFGISPDKALEFIKSSVDADPSNESQDYIKAAGYVKQGVGVAEFAKLVVENNLNLTTNQFTTLLHLLDKGEAGKTGIPQKEENKLEALKVKQELEEEIRDKKEKIINLKKGEEIYEPKMGKFINEGIVKDKQKLKDLEEYSTNYTEDMTWEEYQVALSEHRTEQESIQSLRNEINLMLPAYYSETQEYVQGMSGFPAMSSDTQELVKTMLQENLTSKQLRDLLEMLKKGNNG